MGENVGIIAEFILNRSRGHVDHPLLVPDETGVFGMACWWLNTYGGENARNWVYCGGIRFRHVCVLRI